MREKRDKREQEREDVEEKRKKNREKEIKGKRCDKEKGKRYFKKETGVSVTTSDFDTKRIGEGRDTKNIIQRGGE